MTSITTGRARASSTAGPWAALGGIDAARKRLTAGIIDPIRRASAFARIAIRPATGFLLYGPPGVGKSLLVKATAETAGVRMLALTAPELLARGPGEGEKMLRDAFASARTGPPAILFVDELDLLAPVRPSAAGESQPASRILYTLLAELDRCTAGSGVFVVGSTHRPGAIDPALLRPGRLDEFIYVPLPDAAGRARVLALMLAKTPVDRGVDIAALADRTERFTPADIDDLLRRAGMAALARKANPAKLIAADFEVALAETRASVTEAMERDYEKVQGEIKLNALKLEPMGFLGAGQLKPVRDSKHGASERG